MVKWARKESPVQGHKGDFLKDKINDPIFRITTQVDDTLANAHETIEIFGNSIQETYSIYRFLTAIVQDIYRPKSKLDIDKLLDAGCFEPRKIREWTQMNPICVESFMQVPNLVGPAKTIGYLTMDVPTGSNSIHFRHNISDNQKCYCANCIILGLINMPAWQKIGGQGLHASLNGAPPLYFIPLGNNLFETLSLSLIPGRCLGDGSWCRLSQRREFDTLCYLHGLTFMPRRVKVDWVEGSETCTRCGQPCDLFAKEMIFMAGEKYIGHDWRDPFCAYRQTKDKKLILPVRPYGSHNDWTDFCKNILTSEHLPEIVENKLEYPAWRVFGSVTNKDRIDDTFSVSLKI